MLVTAAVFVSVLRALGRGQRERAWQLLNWGSALTLGLLLLIWALG